MFNLKSQKTTISQEMEDLFKKRTKKHIDLVKKYAKKIEEKYPEQFKGLIDQTKNHDKTKFKEPEKTPYIFITWSYKLKDEGKEIESNEELNKQMNQATEYHVKNNKHHPEFHSKQNKNIINRNDRDAPPKEIIDATKMDTLSIGEMVADWCAMSEEKGENGPKKWADKNIDIRWKFKKDHKNLIYKLIEEIWN
mgnify:CR=1 FL=1